MSDLQAKRVIEYIFQTKTYYSQMRQNEILLPDTKKKLKVKSFHPWTEYTTTSEALDLAIIGLGEGFKPSKTSLDILGKIYGVYLDKIYGVKELKIRKEFLKELEIRKEFLTRSMSIYLVLIWKIK